MPYEGPPIPSIRRHLIDVEQQAATFELVDGATFAVPFPPELSRANAGIKRALFDAERGEYVATLPMGDEVTLEVAGSGGRGEQPRGAVVYLDQLHWIALARHRWAPEKLSEVERAAAGEFVTMAERQEVTLVISAANVTEATQMDGRHRRHVATMLLGLSRGWQMRSPLAIRAQELSAAMRGENPRVPAPFTLRSGAIFADGLEPVDAPEDFPANWKEFFQSIVAMDAVVASIINDEKIPKLEGEAMAEQWAQSHHELAIYMREHKTPKEHVRLNARARFLGDMAQEIAGAARDAGLVERQATFAVLTPARSFASSTL